MKKTLLLAAAVFVAGFGSIDAALAATTRTITTTTKSYYAPAASGWIHVEVGPDILPQEQIYLRDRDYKKRYYRNLKEQRQRIRVLEQAVLQLQSEISLLRQDRQVAEVPRHVCYLSTMMQGTFIGKGFSLTEARAETIKACQGSGSLSCNERQLKCE